MVHSWDKFCKATLCTSWIVLWWNREVRVRGGGWLRDTSTVKYCIYHYISYRYHDLLCAILPLCTILLLNDGLLSFILRSLGRRPVKPALPVASRLQRALWPHFALGLTAICCDLCGSAVSGRSALGHSWGGFLPGRLAGSLRDLSEIAHENSAEIWI